MRRRGVDENQLHAVRREKLGLIGQTWAIPLAFSCVAQIAAELIFDLMTLFIGEQLVQGHHPPSVWRFD